MQSILLTQCLQNDFTERIEKYDRLPNLLHIGYEESLRLLGEIPEEGPLQQFINWSYDQLPEDLSIIHIRDWHDKQDPDQKSHLKQFGDHCIQGTHGADFVFKYPDMNRHHLVHASGFNDFIDTELPDLLECNNKPIRAGIAGIWTEAKVFFLAYELVTRFPNWEIGICSPLCASSSRASHFMALEQLRKILGVNIFASIGDFAGFLTGTTPVTFVQSSQDLPSTFQITSEAPVSIEDRRILAHLFRDCKSGELSSLDGGFSGNMVLRASSVDKMGHRQMPTVVKIGSRNLIAQERMAFEQIEEVMGNSAPRITDFCEYGERGGIKYRYASMNDAKVRTFQDLYLGNADNSFLMRCLDVVFKERLGRLYEAATLEKCNLLEYYDFTSRYAASVRRNVEKIIQTTAFGDKIELLTGVSVPNPCIFYEIDLKQLSEYHAMSHYMSFIHGDLNGRNIIIDAHENVWLIDFFHTHRGHIIRDLIKVENDLMFIMTPIEDEDELRQAFTLTDKLLDSDDLASQPFDQSIKFSSDALNKTARIIQHLRSYYPKLIQSDRAVYQYHVGLMRYAMHTISFDESSLLQKKWALYTGSLLSAKIRDFLQKTAKLRIDTINLDAWSSHGKLGMTILPGRRDRGRNLTDDIQQLKDDNTKSVLSLITVDELSIYGVSNLESEYKKAGIEYRNLPIVDQKIPDKEGLNQTLSWIDEQLKIGNVVLHCVGGLGRSGVVAACYLKKYYGLNGADAIATVRSTRGQRAVETKYQENFVLDFT